MPVQTALPRARAVSPRMQATMHALGPWLRTKVMYAERNQLLKCNCYYELGAALD